MWIPQDKPSKGSPETPVCIHYKNRQVRIKKTPSLTYIEPNPHETDLVPQEFKLLKKEQTKITE